MASTPFKRIFILVVEILSGRMHLERTYINMRTSSSSNSFWENSVKHLGLDVQFSHETLFKAPKAGPLIIISNHPYGVLDGLSISYITEKIRPDFKILASAVLNHIPEVVPYLLPIDLSNRKEAIQHNIDTRQNTLRHLEKGGAVIIFPAGLISKTSDKLGRGIAIDPPWGTFTAKLVKIAKADVLPVFFEGQNSRFFQFASHISRTFRLALIFHEVKVRIGTPVKVVIGKVIPHSELSDLNLYQIIQKLRQETYSLRDKH